MIKREDLRNAINKISAGDPEIGYSLNELFNTRSIDVPVDSGASDSDIPFFLFENEKVHVNKISYFNEKTVPIEQRLLIKYGELAEKQKFEGKDGVDFHKAARQVQSAGLDAIVDYEINYALHRIRKRLNRPVSAKLSATRKYYKSIVSVLLSILQEKTGGDLLQNDNSPPLFTGGIGENCHAFFMRFPFCRESLCQAARINLEFFHVRFLLNCLIEGTAGNLFACVVNEKIGGLIYLHFKKEFFYTGLEIKYIATINADTADPEETGLAGIKGIGTFLIAGVWLLWKGRRLKAKEIFLDSEIGARKFYESSGFVYRHPLSYVMGRPKGYLLLSILDMVRQCGHLNQSAIQEIKRLIRVQIKLLQKGRVSGNDKECAASFIIKCMKMNNFPEISEIALQMLSLRKKKIPEAGSLIKQAETQLIAQSQNFSETVQQTVAVVFDKCFEKHLKGVLHMESAKRVRAVFDLLEDKALLSKYIRVMPRPATKEELSWVHTPGYIEKIAHTAGKPFYSLDLDTQTTPDSYETARLAAGGVFSLIDKILNSENTGRGFAFVRPPGHHAEPDRAMGFCLFNNTALGAAYLKKRYRFEKVMIADIDVHHGNGTQKAFYDTSDVLYFSMHQFPCFPGTGKVSETGCGKGEGFTINVPMRKGQNDMDVATVVRYLAAPVAREYQPDMILVSCGFDFYAHDPLGGMNVTPGGYALVTHILKEIAEKVCRGRIAFILEGGYSIEGIRSCGLRVMKELCDIPTLAPQTIEKLETTNPSGLPALKKAIEIQKKYWKILR